MWRQGKGEYLGRMRQYRSTWPGLLPAPGSSLDAKVVVEESIMCTKRMSFLMLGVLISAVTTARAESPPEDSVVRVFASLRLPNPIRPWAKQNSVEAMGTGIIIDGKRILTNAHVVVYASEVFIPDRKGGERLNANVATIGPEIDLATLTLEDEIFFKDRPGLARTSKLPAAHSQVSLLGFPVGGTGLAVSQGVVSRINYASYDDRTEGLQIQVDTQPSPGNSGGPALVNGKMVGLVFRRTQNAGYVIPNEEIDSYLEDVKDGRYDGKPRVTDHFQVLVNAGLRKKLGMARADHGVMVRKSGCANATHPLLEWDVLTEIGTSAIDNEGMVDFGDNLGMPFMALVPRLAKDGSIPVRLVRDGKPLQIAMPVTREDDRLIKPYRGQYPPYFVHGPLVFSPVIEQAISTYAQASPQVMIGSPLASTADERVTIPGEELVVVTAPFLAHRIVRGYGDPFGLVVKDVDNVKIKHLKHLVEVLRDGKGEFLTIRFHGDFAETLVFPRKAVEEATAGLMAENGIPKRGTDAEPDDCSELVRLRRTARPGLWLVSTVGASRPG